MSDKTKLRDMPEWAWMSPPERAGLMSMIVMFAMFAVFIVSLYACIWFGGEFWSRLCVTSIVTIILSFAALMASAQAQKSWQENHPEECD